MDSSSEWSKLSKTYQNAIKGESLWSSDIQKVNRAMKACCAALDQAFKDCETAAAKNDHGKAFGAWAEFRAAKKKIKPLAAAVRVELGNTDKGNSPKTYRALKVLATGIESINGTASYIGRSLEDKVKNVGKQLESSDRVAQVHEKALKQIKKGVQKSIACIQALKSDPTPKNWDDQWNRGMGRDPIMGLRTLRDAKGKGGFGGVPDPTPHMTALAGYNTGQKDTKLPADADAAEILRRLKVFSGVIKAVANDYRGHW